MKDFRWEYSEEEMVQMIVNMKTIAKDFYYKAITTNCHPFIEFCGLMMKYIETCEEAMKQGVNFPFANKHSGVAIPMAKHHLIYLAEKFECIFGPTLDDLENRLTFLEAMHWTTESNALRAHMDAASTTSSTETIFSSPPSKPGEPPLVSSVG